MTARELIKKYNITLSPTDDSKIRINNVPKDEAAVKEIKAAKAEIIATIKADKEAKEAERDRRRQNVESIEGLAELKAAINAWNEWHDKLNASFEGEEAVGGMGVGPKPGNPEIIMEQHPQAAAYIEVQKMARKANMKLSAIGQKALERFEDNPADWEAIIADMKAEEKAFVAESIWD